MLLENCNISNNFQLKVPSVSSFDEQILSEMIEYLGSNQLESGELPLFCFSKGTLFQPRYLKTVFLTAFQSVLHGDIKNKDLQKITQNSNSFLKAERSSNGLWRFFGKDSDIDPDIDDTFAALCALRTDKETMESLPDILNQLFLLRSKSGLFYTWFRKTNNTIDLTVNANLLFYLSVLGVDKEILYDLLDSIFSSIRRADTFISRYYLSTFTFTFSLKTACEILNIKNNMCILHNDLTIKPWFKQNSLNLYYYSDILDTILKINFKNRIFEKSQSSNISLSDPGSLLLH